MPRIRGLHIRRVGAGSSGVVHLYRPADLQDAPSLSGSPAEDQEQSPAATKTTEKGPHSENKADITKRKKRRPRALPTKTNRLCAAESSKAEATSMSWKDDREGPGFQVLQQPTETCFDILAKRSSDRQLRAGECSPLSRVGNDSSHQPPAKATCSTPYESDKPHSQWQAQACSGSRKDDVGQTASVLRMGPDRTNGNTHGESDSIWHLQSETISASLKDTSNQSDLVLPQKSTNTNCSVPGESGSISHVQVEAISANVNERNEQRARVPPHNPTETNFSAPGENGSNTTLQAEEISASLKVGSAQRSMRPPQKPAMTDCSPPGESTANREFLPKPISASLRDSIEPPTIAPPQQPNKTNRGALGESNSNTELQAEAGLKEQQPTKANCNTSGESGSVSRLQVEAVFASLKDSNEERAVVPSQRPTKTNRSTSRESSSNREMLVEVISADLKAGGNEQRFVVPPPKPAITNRSTPGESTSYGELLAKPISADLKDTSCDTQVGRNSNRELPAEAIWTSLRDGDELPSVDPPQQHSKANCSTTREQAEASSAIMAVSDEQPSSVPTQQPMRTDYLQAEVVAATLKDSIEQGAVVPHRQPATTSRSAPREGSANKELQGRVILARGNNEPSLDLPSPAFISPTCSPSIESSQQTVIAEKKPHDNHSPVMETTVAETRFMESVSTLAQSPRQHTVDGNKDCTRMSSRNAVTNRFSRGCLVQDLECIDIDSVTPKKANFPQPSGPKKRKSMDEKPDQVVCCACALDRAQCFREKRRRRSVGSFSDFVDSAEPRAAGRSILICPSQGLQLSHVDGWCFDLSLPVEEGASVRPPVWQSNNGQTLQWEAHVLRVIDNTSSKMSRPLRYCFPKPLHLSISNDATKNIHLSRLTLRLDVCQDGPVEVLGTLEDVMKLNFRQNTGPIPESMVAWFLVQAIRIVGILHECNVTHNDLGLGSFLLFRRPSRGQQVEGKAGKIHDKDSCTWMMQCIGFGAKSHVLGRQTSKDVLKKSAKQHEVTGRLAANAVGTTSCKNWHFKDDASSLAQIARELLSGDHRQHVSPAWDKLFSALMHPPGSRYGTHCINWDSVLNEAGGRKRRSARRNSSSEAISVSPTWSELENAYRLLGLLMKIGPSSRSSYFYCASDESTVGFLDKLMERAFHRDETHAE